MVNKLSFMKDKYNKEFLFDIKHASEMKKLNQPVILDFYVIIASINGSGSMIIENHEVTLENDKMLFIAANREVIDTNADYGESVFMLFDEQFLQMFFQDVYFLQRFEFIRDVNNPPYVYLSDADSAILCKLMKEMDAEMKSLKEDSDHVLRSLLYFILIKINRIYSNSYNTFGSLIENNHILSFKKMLEENVRERHGVQFYANQLGISRTYLNKISKEFLGKTSKELISDRLLIEAKRELLYTKNNIYDIAVNLNYYEMSSFVRFFKGMTNMTPSQFRREFSK